MIAEVPIFPRYPGVARAVARRLARRVIEQRIRAVHLPQRPFGLRPLRSASIRTRLWKQRSASSTNNVASDRVRLVG